MGVWQLAWRAQAPRPSQGTSLGKRARLKQYGEVPARGKGKKPVVQNRDAVKAGTWQGLGTVGVRRGPENQTASGSPVLLVAWTASCFLRVPAGKSEIKSSRKDFFFPC